MKAYASNALWVASCFPGWLRFRRAAEHVEESQTQLLLHYLRANVNTEYGRLHQFDSIHSPKQFQEQIPLSAYDDYAGYIARIGEGQQSVLSSDPVHMFELSSGSTAPSKLIPYTHSLKAEFQRGLAAWIYNLYTSFPELQRGPAYWSITPLVDGKRFTSGDIPIGFESDSAYLGLFGKLLIDSVMAVPNAVKNISNVDSFRYVTLLFLLHCDDLRLISVWNPTFLTLLLEPLPEWWDSLLKDISEGTLTPPAPLDETIRHALTKKLSRNISSCSEAERMQHAKKLAQLRPDNYASLWPRLTLLSCWADGISESYARELQAKFPNVTLQPKGLLATEAFVSFPLVGKTGGVLAVNSHYFEFLTESGNILLAHQLEKGETYSVVVTTGGGLYRYQLNDLIEVTDFYNQVPCFNFIGKADRVSDYFGEKLNEQFVANVLARLFEKHSLSPTFFMLAPDDIGIFHYTLYLELPDYPTTQLPDYLTIQLDSALRANFHYDYCRKLGQLGETQMTLVTRGAEKYIRACQSRGQKLGDIKPSVLQKSTGWEKWFGNTKKP